MALSDLELVISEQEREVDPNEIFRRLTLRGTIQNIWGPQESGLREWHTQFRNQADNIVQMNTGGGKTLVGLLMAQSLVNETNGKVLYVCANNQLVEQTVEKAQECGLNVASRYHGGWQRKIDFDRADTFCVTNYATVFNGLSVFRNTEMDAVIFDDAHVAESILRSQYTVQFDRESDNFKKILNLFRRHFAASCNSSRFDEAYGGEWNVLLYVPMFLVGRHNKELRKILIEGDIEKDANNKFPWEHLKSKLHLCIILFSGQRVEITPSILPLHRTQCFTKSVRRIYLTATIPTRSSFLRTFGVTGTKVINPSGKSGDAQRLFVFPLKDDEEKQKSEALAYIGKRKSCVISPSTKRAGEWKPPAKIYDAKSGHAGIKEFCESEENEMLGLVASTLSVLNCRV